MEEEGEQVEEEDEVSPPTSSASLQQFSDQLRQEESKISSTTSRCVH